MANNRSPCEKDGAFSKWTFHYLQLRHRCERALFEMGKRVPRLQRLCAIAVARQCGRGKRRIASLLEPLLPPTVLRLVVAYCIMDEEEWKRFDYEYTYLMRFRNGRDLNKAQNTVDFYEDLPKREYRSLFHPEWIYVPHHPRKRMRTRDGCETQ